MGKKMKAILTVVIFSLLIAGPYPVWSIVRERVSEENTENRNLAELPTFSFSEIEEFPNAMEEYINDHLPFRSMLIEMNSMIDYYILKTSPSDGVEIGKDGWLFYKAERSMDFYTGRKLYSEEELRTISENMEKTRKNLEKKGISFALFIAPNRERVYREYMPSFYGNPADHCALQQVLEYLEDNTDVKVICPYDALMDYKDNNPDLILYHKTDTHWNDLGAYIGVCTLFDELDIRWEKDDVSIEKTEDTPGDMANMLNLGKVLDPGETYRLSGFQKDDTENIEEMDFFGHWKFVSPSAENGRILVCRDSFCTAMRQFLIEAFRESDLVHYSNFSNDLIDLEKPDIYVYEICERNMDHLLEYSY